MAVIRYRAKALAPVQTAVGHTLMDAGRGELGMAVLDAKAFPLIAGGQVLDFMVHASVSTDGGCVDLLLGGPDADDVASELETDHIINGEIVGLEPVYPPYSPDDEPSQGVPTLADGFRIADGVVFWTPDPKPYVYPGLEQLPDDGPPLIEDPIEEAA